MGSTTPTISTSRRWQAASNDMDDGNLLQRASRRVASSGCVDEKIEKLDSDARRRSKDTGATLGASLERPLLIRFIVAPLPRPGSQLASPPRGKNLFKRRNSPRPKQREKIMHREDINEARRPALLEINPR